MEADITGDDGAGRERKMRVDYPSNSRSSKNPPAEAGRVKTERVITGEVVERKRKFGSGFFSNFVAEDSGTVFQYVIMDVLLPAAKNMVSDAVSQGVERMLFGENRRPASTGRQGYVSYNTKSSANRGGVGERDLSRAARTNHDFTEVIIENRGEAEDVLDGLRNLINQYDVARVSDFYDLIGKTSEFTDEKWGWYDLRSAQVRPVRGGYLLSLPRTQAIT